MPQVEPEGIRLLTETGMTDIAHLLRPGHLQSLANILKDPEVISTRCSSRNLTRGDLTCAHPSTHSSFP